MRGVLRDQDIVELVSAVPIKKSVGDDFLICLEDGKQMGLRQQRAQEGRKPTKK
jgi:predicted transcriptional regulator